MTNDECPLKTQKKLFFCYKFSLPLPLYKRAQNTKFYSLVIGH